MKELNCIVCLEPMKVKHIESMSGDSIFLQACGTKACPVMGLYQVGRNPETDEIEWN